MFYKSPKIFIFNIFTKNMAVLILFITKYARHFQRMLPKFIGFHKNIIKRLCQARDSMQSINKLRVSPVHHLTNCNQWPVL
jgi:hypothetical protein